MSHLSHEMNTRESHYPVLFDTFRPNSTSRMESSCKTSAPAEANSHFAIMHEQAPERRADGLD